MQALVCELERKLEELLLRFEMRTGVKISHVEVKRLPKHGTPLIQILIGNRQ